MAASETVDKKRRAKGAYVFDRLTCSAIALQLGVSSATVRRWKKQAKSRNGDDWDAARQAHLLSGSGLEPIVTTMAEEMVLSGTALQKAISELPDVGEDGKPDIVLIEKKIKLMAMLSDSLAKGVASAGRAAPKLNEYAVAQDILRRLGEFVVKDFPQHATAMLEILEPFGAELARDYAS